MKSIISWNVLYREYEKMYKKTSKILLKYPDERDRVNSMVKIIESLIDPETVICLQEASSSVAEAMKIAAGNTHTVFSYNIRNDEHLLTIAPSRFRLIGTISHETSNGYIIVTDGFLKIINCHLLPQKYVKYDVMEFLKSFNEKDNTATFIAGDFNENYIRVAEKLKGDYVCPSYGITYKKRKIDHIIFNGGFTKYRASRILQNLISDHHIVKIEVY